MCSSPHCLATLIPNPELRAQNACPHTQAAAIESEGDGVVDYTDTGSVIEEVIVESPTIFHPKNRRVILLG